MNTVCYEFTICFANSLWIHYFFVNSLRNTSLLRENTSNSLFFSRSHFEFTIFSRIHFQFPLLFIYSLIIPFEFSLLWIHHMIREFTFNSRIHFEFIFFSRIHFQSSLFFANTLTIQFEFSLLWIHHMFREFTFNFLSSSQIHLQFPLNSVRYEFIICFATSLSIHEFTLNSFSFANSQSPLRIYNLLCEFTSNLLSISRINFEFFIFTRIHFKFTIYYKNSLWISSLHREFTNPSLRIQFAKSLPIHYFFEKSLPIPFEFSLLWIHHLFR